MSSNTVTATVPVGSGPFGVAINTSGTKVYVANWDSNDVSVIDTSTNTVTATVPVGKEPKGVAVTPDGTKIYVTNTNSSTVSVIDTATNSVIANVSVGIYPLGVAVSPDGNKAYVTNYGSGNVSVINTANNTVTTTISVGSIPSGITINSAGTKAYVANHGSNTVSVINTITNTVTATIPVGSGPTAFGQFVVSPLVPTGANLSIYKQAPLSIVPGNSMTYILHYHNFGNKDAQNVTIEDILSDNVEFDSASNGGVYNSTTRTITWDIGSVAPEGHGYRTLTVRIPQSAVIGTVILNNANISTSDPETKYDDNEAHAQTRVISGVVYTDPGGYIYDVDTWERIANASVWLQASDGIGGWENVSTGESVPVAQPDVNPQVTDEDGVYQWDVLNGSYRVHVEAPGYEPANSIVVSVPPPVTDLHVGLVRIPVLLAANFSTNVTSGYAPLSVQFTDISSNVTEWNWDFGDGTNSTEQNPTHTYLAAGNYTVNLTVSNGDGTDSKLATITVLEPIPPASNVSSNGTNVYAPVNVQIGNLSQNATRINWNIGSQLIGANASGNGTNVSAPVNVQIGNLSQNATTINWNIRSQLFGVNFSNNGINISAPVTVQVDNLSQNATTINWNI